MSDQQDHQVHSQDHIIAYYSEQETAQFCHLELHVIHYLAEAGVISGVQAVGDEQRRYNDADLALLRRVRRLYQDLGVNLEGVEIILRLASHIESLQREIARYQALAEQRATGQPAPADDLDEPEPETRLS